MYASHNTDTVNEKNARSKDRGKSLPITLAILALGVAITLIAALPVHMLHAASSPRAGIPDGSHAVGVYSVDGGYGLRESFYAELLAQLLGD